MPRIAGQIDLHKNEAILDAAAEILAERGLSAPIEAIAKLAGVSKQTIYNHYGCKAELLRALVARRSRTLAAALQKNGDEAAPVQRLANFAERMLSPVLSSRSLSIMRVIALAADNEENNLATQIYEAGPSTSQRELSTFLEQQSDEGLLDINDPNQAARFFIGMVVGHTQLRQLMRLPVTLTPQEVRDWAEEAAARFMRAYSPSPCSVAVSV